MFRQSSRLSQSIELALWSVGLICVLAYGVVRLQAVRAQASAISVLDGGRQTDQSLWSSQRIAMYSPDGPGRLNAIAVVNIPAIDLRVAVFEGTSELILNAGIGRVPGTARVGERGNLALAGHRDGFFRGLKDIEIGDDITIKHVDGQNHYKVTSLDVVGPDDISVLASSATPMLTLITCYPFYFVGSAPKRYIVRAEQKADQ